MRFIERTVARFKNSHFFRNVAILTTGTALAQTIPLLASPILTRIYTPTDFGLLALFMAVVQSVLPMVSGKYDIALVLPKDESRGEQLFGVAVLFAIVVSCALAVFLFVAHDWVIGVLDAGKLGWWIYLTPLVLFMSGIYGASNYFANRKKFYGLMAKAGFMQAAVTGVVTVGLGLAGFGFVGLLLGNILALLVTTFYIIRSSAPHLFRTVFGNWKKKRVLMAKYKDYPIFNGSTSLIGGITLSLPVFFIAHYFPESIIGYYAIVLRVANKPLSFLTTPISQVNLKKVVDLVNEGRNVTKYIFKLALVLTSIVSVPTVLLVVFAPEIFSFVLSEQWHTAGVYCQIIIPAISVRFVVSTLSTTIGATNHNKFAAIWRVIALISTISMFAWFAPQGNIITLLYACLVNDVLLYLLFFVFILRAAQKPNN